MDELEILSVNRSLIAELLDKCWELGGYSVGEAEFEKYHWVEDARQHLKEMDERISELLKHKKHEGGAIASSKPNT